MGAMPNSDRTEFGEYLRRRRAAMSPPDPQSGVRVSRRRVPGLRRQEVSDIAGISVEYYTRLEQGRAPRPSREILTSLARAFGLSDAERDHLFRLGGESPPGPASPASVIRPGLLRLLRGLDDTMPVTVHDGRLDLLARNKAARELLGTLTGGGPFGRNIAYQAFTTDVIAYLLGGEGSERFLRVAAAELRMALSRYPDDAYLRSLLAELTATSQSFRDHWEEGEVSVARSAVKQMRHPARGWARFEIEVLHDPERDHWIMLYTPHGEE
ncbi:helix-turn-helix domain-containing protein [Nocardiopsis dassonvillei subsp. albirubida]|uniref:Helix-turn-helix domain-containing protein n=2 Tax=Nocardiopsis alborubida TaxID=146802 RepID=A0A7X6MFP1_9ACTN|nr:helix-turn-helix domain-containing protein [Nocardiopsis alborubida]